jgi:hypothetical protein
VSALQRAISELIATENRLASEALAKPADKSEFGYGHACGLFQGIRMSRSILECALAESDPKSERASQ